MNDAEIVYYSDWRDWMASLMGHRSKKMGMKVRMDTTNLVILFYVMENEFEPAEITGWHVTHLNESRDMILLDASIPKDIKRNYLLNFNNLESTWEKTGRKITYA